MASRKSQREGPASRSGHQLEPNPPKVPVEFNIFGKGMFEFDSDNENSIDDLSTSRSNSTRPEEEDINLTHHRRRSLPRVPSNASEGDQVSNSSDQNPQPSLGWPLAAKTERLFRARIKKPATAMKVQIINKTQDEKQLSEMEMMKERFSKLLLGEDMSGGGKGVSSALAISNAITNLAASIFTELSKLEPLAPERKTMWCREIGWFLSVVDHIVEFVPSSQHALDGSNMEIMVTKPRSDLQMNIPALRKLDAMLLETLEKFKEPEFWYVNKSMEGDAFGDNCNQQRQEHKWWLPTPHVPPGGLSRNARKILQSQRESVNQILKAAMAINAQVLSEMEIPDAYLESLPKAAKASLGDMIYRHITSDQFSAEGLLSSLDLSSEHNIQDIINRIEASIAIWKRKINKECKNNAMSSWGTSHSDKKELFGERAESLLLLLKLRFRGLPQTALDMSKIQYNKDVGQSVLESYSRVLESLAYNILSRIDDVLYADNLNKRVPSRGYYERSSSSSSIATNSVSEDPSSYWSASPSPGSPCRA
ncbi:hypothetical protein SUGI_0145070 [Cryptomeria japonica]|nr:hypothetical protein SUGI_0145070 [Cryptomeria japonica]